MENDMKNKKLCGDSGYELAAFAAKQINYHASWGTSDHASTQIAENLDVAGAEASRHCPDRCRGRTQRRRHLTWVASAAGGRDDATNGLCTP